MSDLNQMNKSTLRELLLEWYYTHDAIQSGPDIVNEIIYIIKDWLPKLQSSNGSQNAYVECTVVGYNDAIKEILQKLK